MTKWYDSAHKSNNFRTLAMFTALEKIVNYLKRCTHLPEKISLSYVLTVAGSETKPMFP
jgi:hypothetical protein